MLTLVAPATANGSTFTGPAVVLPSGVTTATVLIAATMGYAPCLIAVDGLLGGVWQVVAQAGQQPWGHDGWGARLGITAPLPTALRARIIESGGQHIGVAVETS